MSGVLVILGLALTLQSPQQIRPGADSARPARLPPSGRAIATHADKAPVIDGVDDDDVWQKAKAISDFKQWQPTEGKEPRFRTEAKVAYDAGNLYVFVRAFDPHEDIEVAGIVGDFRLRAETRFFPFRRLPLLEIGNRFRLLPYVVVVDAVDHRRLVGVRGDGAAGWREPRRASRIGARADLLRGLQRQGQTQNDENAGHSTFR